jgi:hypothetical protein
MSLATLSASDNFRDSNIKKKKKNRSAPVSTDKQIRTG